MFTVHTTIMRMVIHAESIIATGGFFDNKTMREKYLRFADADGLAQTGKTGDGIQMAWAVGGGACASAGHS